MQKAKEHGGNLRQKPENRGSFRLDPGWAQDRRSEIPGTLFSATSKQAFVPKMTDGRQLQKLFILGRAHSQMGTGTEGQKLPLSLLTAILKGTAWAQNGHRMGTEQFSMPKQ